MLLVIIAASLYLRYGGVTHECIYDAVLAESSATRARVDERCDAIDKKLDRIEGKLDRILEIATRPMPDGLQPAK